MQAVDDSIATCERNMTAVIAERSLLQTHIASQARVANTAGVKMEADEIERAIAAQLEPRSAPVPAAARRGSLSRSDSKRHGPLPVLGMKDR